MAEVTFAALFLPCCGGGIDLAHRKTTRCAQSWLTRSRKRALSSRPQMSICRALFGVSSKASLIVASSSEVLFALFAGPAGTSVS